jgi:ankyrin repeat protein
MAEFLDASDLSLPELALRLRWSSAVVRAAKNPEEIAEQDEDGLTALHWACCNPPPVWVFRALLEHQEPFLQAACTKDMNGMTPLQCACACRAPVEVISLLVQACPECVKISDYDFWTPLHFIVSCVRKEELVLRYVHKVSEILLATMPRLASAEDSRGNTALRSLCEFFEAELGNFCYDADQDEARHMDLFWAIVTLHLDALVPPSPCSSILHRMVRATCSHCPLKLLICTVKEYPHFLLHQDSSGNTPLHLAVLHKSYVLHLVRLDPAAATAAANLRNRNGQTPFALANKTSEHWTEAHSILLEACPSVLETLALDDALYADILGHATEQADTIFAILREKPSLVASNR